MLRSRLLRALVLGGCVTLGLTGCQRPEVRDRTVSAPADAASRSAGHDSPARPEAAPGQSMADLDGQPPAGVSAPETESPPPAEPETAEPETDKPEGDKPEGEGEGEPASEAAPPAEHEAAEGEQAPVAKLYSAPARRRSPAPSRRPRQTQPAPAP
ncbi:MAG: hypothetical protein ACKVWR_14710, partial [Acidimicrobiales bacterium]